MLRYLRPPIRAHIRQRFPKLRQRGISLVEAMIGLAIMAMVLAGTIVTFNAAQERASVSATTAALTPLVLDVTTRKQQLRALGHSKYVVNAAPPTTAGSCSTAACTTATTCASSTHTCQGGSGTAGVWTAGITGHPAAAVLPSLVSAAAPLGTHIPTGTSGEGLSVGVVVNPGAGTNKATLANTMGAGGKTTDEIAESGVIAFAIPLDVTESACADIARGFNTRNGVNLALCFANTTTGGNSLPTEFPYVLGLAL